VQRLLIDHQGRATHPYGGAPYLATFAYQQVPGFEREAIAFLRAEIYAEDVVGVDAPPLDVGVPQPGCTAEYLIYLG